MQLPSSSLFLSDQQERPYRILVIDPSDMTHAAIRTGLAALPCEFRFASTGSDALELVESDSFDLIFLACVMPDIDGYVIAASIRSYEDRIGLRTPLVALSYAYKQEERANCRAAGISEVINLPCTAAIVESTARKLLPRQSRPLQQESLFPDWSLGLPDCDPLNPDVFNELKIVDPGLESIRCFTQDLPEMLAQLELALREGDKATAARTAHAIKGSSATVGGVHVAYLATEIQRMAAVDNLAGARIAMPSLVESYDSLRLILESELLSVSTGDHMETAEAGVMDKPLCVLIVDDDRTTRRAYRQSLQAARIRVEEAADGSEALGKLVEVAPDMIVMDASMPVMDGFEACKRIRGTPGYEDTPILMITSSDDPHALSKATAAGADDFYEKPIAIHFFRDRVLSKAMGARAIALAHQRSNNDSLTELSNRAHLLSTAQRLISHSTQETVTLLNADIGRAMVVGQMHGHDARDTLIRLAGQMFKRSMLDADCVARIQQDQFAAVFSGPDALLIASAAAERLQLAFNLPLTVANHDIPAFPTSGIASAPTDARDAKSLLAAAESATKAARENGQSVRFYNVSMEESLSRHALLSEGLFRAVDDRALEVLYRPVMRLATQRVEAVEATMRWIPANRDAILGEELMALAENLGLTDAINANLLQAACGQVRQWRSQGLPQLRLIVQLYFNELNAEFLRNVVPDILRDAGLPADALVIEIAYPSFQKISMAGRSAVAQLRALGAGVWIGRYRQSSTLPQALASLPVTGLRLDRQLSRRIEFDSRDAEELHRLAASAASYDLEIIATGIRSTEQAARAGKAKCTFIQGPLIGDWLDRAGVETHRTLWRTNLADLPAGAT